MLNLKIVGLIVETSYFLHDTFILSLLLMDLHLLYAGFLVYKKSLLGYI